MHREANRTMLYFLCVSPSKSDCPIFIRRRISEDDTSSVTICVPSLAVSRVKLAGRFLGIVYPARSSRMNSQSLYSRSPASGTPGASHVCSDPGPLIRSAPSTNLKSGPGYSC
eukprot:4946511-Pleurochrysis_carterae.AAC.1